MTMPHERTRSLRWGFELLAEMLSDETIDESMRAIAHELLDKYPRPDQIRRLIETDAHALPEEAAAALVAAGRLWTRLDRSQQGTAATRHSLLYTQRHWPEDSIAKSLARGPLDGIRGWLLPEDHGYTGGNP